MLTDLHIIIIDYDNHFVKQDSCENLKIREISIFALFLGLFHRKSLVFVSRIGISGKNEPVLTDFFPKSTQAILPKMVALCNMGNG